jgi:methylamine dehydrogenase accessory protein MauD
MSDALWVSNALLWVVVLALGAVVVALVRQIGVLHERLRPVGALALANGPEIGAAAPRVDAVDLAGAPFAVGGPDPEGRDTLLLFLSPTCPVCKALLPALASLARESGLRVVLASDGPREEQAAFVARERIALPYVLGTALGLAYRVGKLPWAALVDGSGVLRAQGLVNTREHLESLLEAKARGVASIQEYLERERKGAA